MITLESVLDDSYHNPILTIDTSDMVNNVDVAEAFSTFHMALEAVELYSCAGYVAESTNPENMHVVMEGLGEAIKNAWHKFIEALKKFGAWIKGFFVKTEVKLDDAASKAAAAADIVEQAVAENGGGGDSSNDSGKPASDSNQSNADSGTPLSNAPTNHPKPAPEPEVPPSHPDDREETDDEVNENIEKAEEIRSSSNDTEPAGPGKMERFWDGTKWVIKNVGATYGGAIKDAGKNLAQGAKEFGTHMGKSVAKGVADGVDGIKDGAKIVKDKLIVLKNGVHAKTNDIIAAIKTNVNKYIEDHKNLKLSCNPTMITGKEYELVKRSGNDETLASLSAKFVKIVENDLHLLDGMEKPKFFKDHENEVDEDWKYWINDFNRIKTPSTNWNDELKSISEYIKQSTKIRAKQVERIAKDIQSLRKKFKFDEIIARVEKITKSHESTINEHANNKYATKVMKVTLQQLNIIMVCTKNFALLFNKCTEAIIKDCDVYIKSLVK